MPNAPITARMVESKSRMPAPIIFLANAGKIGLLADAMDVLIVYTLLDDARDGVARLMTMRTPDDINPAVVMGMAEAFTTCPALLMPRTSLNVERGRPPRSMKLLSLLHSMCRREAGDETPTKEAHVVAHNNREVVLT